ncbi:MAG: hypothetical protein U1A25_00805 [Candidatus Sungbacteria bacterium]|nr:hypothetical protein [Candidatus Sungbacteria bacterium]
MEAVTRNWRRGLFGAVRDTVSGGKIKDARQATYVLLVFASVLILASLFIFFGTGSAPKNAFSPNFIHIDQSQYRIKR